jgi:hypothetical protein
MNKLPFDVLFSVFGFLLPRERIKIKYTSNTFYNVYLKHLQSRNNLNKDKFILYRRNDRSILYKDNLIYNIVKSNDTHIFITSGRSKKVSTVKKLFNKHGVVYCKFLDKCLYLYEKQHVKEIGKDICHKCKNLDISEECGIFNKFCEFKDCKKLRYYNSGRFKDLKNKIVPNDYFNDYCSHMFCSGCILKLSVRYNCNNKYVQKIFVNQVEQNNFLCSKTFYKSK